MAFNLMNSNDINITQTGSDIKLNFTQNAVANKNVYSTSETRIGTWIDGKPIYRKAINWGNVSTNNTLSGVLPNLDTLLSIRGTCYSSQYSQYYNIPNIHTNISDFYINALIINNTNLQIRYGSGFTSLSKVIIILEYTKTTD